MTPPVGRPRSVTYASRLLYAYSPIGIVYVLVLMVASRDAMQAKLLPLGVVSLALTVVFGYFVGRGRNWARILIWIAAAGALVNIPMIIKLFLLSDYYSRKPPWFEPVQLTEWTIQGLVIFTLAILLLLPSARAYFRNGPATVPVTEQGPVTPTRPAPPLN
jgi:hypothetical protein